MDATAPLDRHDGLTRAFHWISAVYLVGMIADGYWMNHFLPRGGKIGAFHWHAMFGIYFLFLVLARLAWRPHAIRPEHPTAISWLEERGARLVQGLMYALMVAIPIAGWITWSARASRRAIYLPLGVKLPWAVGRPERGLEHSSEDIHIYMAYALLSLAVIHVAMALRHHFVRRDDVLKGMLPE